MCSNIPEFPNSRSDLYPFFWDLPVVSKALQFLVECVPFGLAVFTDHLENAPQENAVCICVDVANLLSSSIAAVDLLGQSAQFFVASRVKGAEFYVAAIHVSAMPVIAPESY